MSDLLPTLGDYIAAAVWLVIGGTLIGCEVTAWRDRRQIRRAVERENARDHYARPHRW